jgi:hypothetical protein
MVDSAFGEAFLLAAGKGWYITLDEGKGSRQINTFNGEFKLAR